MKLEFQTYTLDLQNTFTLATSSRKNTPVVLTQIEHKGITGYGEGSMPPYLGESHQTAIKFLSQVDVSQLDNPHDITSIMSYVDQIDEGNCAAKASIDIALHDLVGKLKNKSRHEIWGLSLDKIPVTSYTIGIDEESIIRKKVKEAE
jgi:L-alanine-DL-glutamate epimerase-like enolase superfamily enzyme